MNRSSNIYSIGAVSLQKVQEQPFRNVPFAFLYPTAADGELETAARKLALGDMEDNRAELVQSIHTWVIRTPDHIILVDTGSGNDKQRPLNPIFHEQRIPFLQRLKDEAGISAEDVDYVINTHLHVDHSGWNTVLRDGRWVPTFPNARYVFPRLEAEYYGSPASHNDANIPSRGVFEDSILPVMEADLVDFIEPEGGRYLDLFTFIPTSGHSIGHMSVELVSQGEAAIFGGDVMHTPVQVFNPHLNTVFCEFYEQALSSRQRLLSKLADEGSLYLSTHFAGSSAGYVTRTDDGYAWTMPEKENTMTTKIDLDRIVFEDHRIDSDTDGISLYIRNKRPIGVDHFGAERTIVMVHGATFSSGSLYDVRLGGFSYMDYLAAAGFDVFAVDVRGYGHSTRPPEMEQDGNLSPPVVKTDTGVADFRAAVDFVLRHRAIERTNIFGMSWGGTVAGAYTAANPFKVVSASLRRNG